VKPLQYLGVALKSRLGRIVTRGRTFIPEVDGLRFIAITAVILFHLRTFTPSQGIAAHTLGSAASTLLDLGRYGVQLFFILSGFLLAMPFANWRLGLGKRPSLRAYYLRRLTRLEPPFMIAMLGLFLLGIVVHIVSGPGAASKWPGIPQWPHFIATIFYQHNLVYGRTSPITPVEWSLEVEVQFYLLAPLLTLPFSIRNAITRRMVFAGVIVGSPLLRGLVSPHFWQRFDSLPVHLEFFAAGFFLADLFLVNWKQAPSRSFQWDVASLVGWPVLVTLMLFPKYSVFIAPVALFCYVGAFRGRISSWALSRPEVTVLGGMCYTLYLLHYTIIMASNTLLRKLALTWGFLARFALDALIVLPIILIVSVVFFYICERPFMNPAWPSRIMQRLRGSPSVPLSSA
jgi:peptidoglycan/LPS O-acetylase OafA/YrhL